MKIFPHLFSFILTAVIHFFHYKALKPHASAPDYYFSNNRKPVDIRHRAFIVSRLMIVNEAELTRRTAVLSAKH